MSRLAEAVEGLARASGVWDNSWQATAPTDNTTAAVYLLASLLRPRVRDCPACVERGGGWEWRHVWAGFERDDLARHGWSYASGWTRHQRLESETQVWVCSRPCPTCSEPGEPRACDAQWCDAGTLNATYRELHAVPWRQRPGAHWRPADGLRVEAGCPDCEGTGSQPGPLVPTGKVSQSWGEVLLAALPRVTPVWEVNTNKPIRDEIEPGDPLAIADLSVLADELQADGQLLGEWLALVCAGLKAALAQRSDALEKACRAATVALTTPAERYELEQDQRAASDRAERETELTKPQLAMEHLRRWLASGERRVSHDDDGLAVLLHVLADYLGEDWFVHGWFAPAELGADFSFYSERYNVNVNLSSIGHCEVRYAP